MGGEAVLPPSDLTTKNDLYAWLYNQVKLLIQDMPQKFTPEANMTIALSNTSALCFYALNKYHDPNAKLESAPVNWLGFYLLQAPGVLGLGPFQGRPACLTIRVGKGVCGKAAAEKKTVIVADVHNFPGHIACDSASNSEIVVPIISSKGGGMLGVLDIDSIHVGLFDEEDQKGLESIVALLEQEVNYFPMKSVLAIQPVFDTPASADIPAFLLPEYTFGPSHRHPANYLSHLTNPTTIGEMVLTEGGEEKESENGHHLIVTPLSTNIPAFRVDTKDTVQISRIAQNEDMRSLHSKELCRSEEAKTVAGWSFRSAKYSCIANKEKLEELSNSTTLSYFPEMLFMSQLEVTPPGYHSSPLIKFNAEAVLQNARTFYKSNYYDSSVRESFRVSSYKKWFQNHYEVKDPGVDWAWRNNFFGIVEVFHHAPVISVGTLTEQEGGIATSMPEHSVSSAVSSSPSSLGLALVTSEMEKDYSINWVLLRDVTQPILFAASHILFEDDLHDNGYVQCSVKIRVLHGAFFILFRYAFEIYGACGGEEVDANVLQETNAPRNDKKNGNDAEVEEEHVNGNGEKISGIVREVRLFHEFGKKIPDKNFPMIIAQEKLIALHPPVRPAEVKEYVETTNNESPEGKGKQFHTLPFGDLEKRIVEGKICRIQHFYVTDEVSPTVVI